MTNEIPTEENIMTIAAPEGSTEPVTDAQREPLDTGLHDWPADIQALEAKNFLLAAERDSLQHERCPSSTPSAAAVTSRGEDRQRRLRRDSPRWHGEPGAERTHSSQASQLDAELEAWSDLRRNCTYWATDCRITSSSARRGERPQYLPDGELGQGPRSARAPSSGRRSRTASSWTPITTTPLSSTSSSRSPASASPGMTDRENSSG